jgi:hypothetical protein
MINTYELLFNHIHIRTKIAIGNRIKKISYDDNTLKNIEKSYLANLLLHHTESLYVTKIQNPEDFSNIPNNVFTISVLTDWTRITENYRIKEVEENFLPKELEKNSIYVFRVKSNVYIYFPMYSSIGIFPQTDRNTMYLELLPLFTTLDLQITHLINITKESPLKVNKKTIIKPEDTEDIRKKLLKEELNGLSVAIQKDNYEIKIKDTLKRINNRRNEIIFLEKDIKQLEKKVIELENSELYKKINNITDDLFILLDRNKLIDKVIIEKEDVYFKISITTAELPWNKFDPNQLETMLPNIWNGYPGFKKYLYKVLNKEAILYFGRYILEYTFAPDEDITSEIKRVDEKYYNPHENIHCYGGYYKYMEDYSKNKDITNLILTQLEFLRHITLGDGGSSDLPNCCYIKNNEGEIIYDGTTNEKFKEDEEEQLEFLFDEEDEIITFDTNDTATNESND